MWVDRVRPPLWDQTIQQNKLLSSLQNLKQAKKGKSNFSAKDMTHLRELGVDLVVLDRELFTEGLSATGLCLQRTVV